MQDTDVLVCVLTLTSIQLYSYSICKPLKRLYLLVNLPFIFIIIIMGVGIRLFGVRRCIL